MSAILLLLAVACETVAALLGFGPLGGGHIDGWISLGLALGFASLLISALPRRP